MFLLVFFSVSSICFSYTNLSIFCWHICVSRGPFISKYTLTHNLALNRVVTLHPEGGMNFFTKNYGNSFNGMLTFLWTKNVKLLVRLDEKWLQFIWGPWMSVPDFRANHSVETLASTNDGTTWKVRELPKWIGYINWEPFISVRNASAIYSTVVKILQVWTKVVDQSTNNAIPWASPLVC